MPSVRVRSRPKGLPMARTFCPTLSLEESPKGMVLRRSPAGGVELDDREVVLRIAANDLGLVAAAVSEVDEELVRVLDHVGSS